MEKNIEILQFLDGALTHEEEAELLHRLSVSPERRDVLRSYIDQRVLFQRDREAINVPYAAEQKLWARLGELMPVTPAATAVTSSGTSAIVSTTRSFRWLSVASIGTVCVVIGLLAGFYLGRSSEADLTATPAQQQTILAVEQPTPMTTAPSADHTRPVEHVTNSRRFEAPLAMVNRDRASDATNQEIPVAMNEEVALAPVPGVSTRQVEQPSYVIEPSERIHSLASLVEETHRSGESVYPMELSFAESFGKQFPADEASRNTQPIITNSSISAMYQIYRGPIELWVGANIGSANLAKRTLREAPQPGGGSELVADVSHLQTTWIGPAVQGRHRFTENISVAASFGASYSALGTLLYGQGDLRYDLTDQVGITFGLRSFNLQYDLTQEQEDVIRNATYKIDAGGSNYGNEWSHNLEFLTGMYFRF